MDWTQQGRTVDESHTVLAGDPHQLPAVAMTRGAEPHEHSAVANRDGAAPPGWAASTDATQAAAEAAEAAWLADQLGTEFGDSADSDVGDSEIDAENDAAGDH